MVDLLRKAADKINVIPLAIFTRVYPGTQDDPDLYARMYYNKFAEGGGTKLPNDVVDYCIDIMIGKVPPAHRPKTASV